MAELPFGEELGHLHGVSAYSNLDDSFFSGEKHFLCGVYTGYKYQCVEFARRYLLSTRAVQFDQCFRAAEIFHMTKLTNVETGEEHPITQCVNGKSTIKPQPGHILIYPNDQELMPVGHVAIVAEVGEDWVGIAEQNQDSFSWNGRCYGRKIPLLRDAETGFWTMQETDPELLQPSGWLFAEGVALRPSVKAPLVPLAKFLPEASPCAVTRRRIAKPTDEVAAQRQGWTVAHIPPGENAAEQQALEFLHATRPQWLSRMKTIVYPNESSGVGCIGCLNASFRAIIHGLQLIFRQKLLSQHLTEPKEFDKWVARRYGVPQDLASLVAEQVATAEQAHRCFAATMTLAFLNDGLPVVIDPNLDNLDGVFEAAVLQGRIAQNNGHDEGWTPSITSDTKRFVEKVLTAHHKCQAQYFLDLGPSSSLPNDVFLSPADAQDYDVQRLNGLLLAEFVKKAREDAARVISIHDVSLTESGSLVLHQTGEAVHVVHKLGTWSTVIKLCAKLPQLYDIVFVAQRQGAVVVYPPLFTHVTRCETFIDDLHRVYALRDETTLNDAQIELKTYLPYLPPRPSAGDEGTGRSMDDLPYSVFTNDPQYNSNPMGSVHLRVRGVSIGGYWSTGVFLERRCDAVTAAASEWRPACYRFMMHKREFTAPEEEDE